MMTKNVSDQSIRTWFDELYNRKQRQSMRDPSSYPVYLDHLQARPGKKLLDVGCGPGWLLKAAVERGLDACGIDFAPAAVSLSREHAPQAESQVGTVTEIPYPDDFFDYVTCIGVLEHFLEMDKAIAEMKRVAGPEAMYCIMVPNSSTFFWKFSQIFSTGHRESNENAKTLRDWKEFFGGHQFRILAIYRDEWNIRKVYSVIGLRNRNWLIHGTRRVVRILWPLRFARQFIFILEKET